MNHHHNQPRGYKLTRHSRRRCYEVTPLTGPGQPIASAKTSMFSSGADLTLHYGPNCAGPVIAICDSGLFSSKMKIGISDPRNPSGNPQAMQWQRFGKSGWSSAEWQMPVVLPELHPRQPRVFTWKRTRSVAASGKSLNPLSSKNYVMTDEAGQVMAVFSRELMGMGGVGTLEMRVDLGPTFEHTAWMTIIAIQEKLRKDDQKAAVS